MPLVPTTPMIVDVGSSETALGSGPFPEDSHLGLPVGRCYRSQSRREQSECKGNIPGAGQRDGDAEHHYRPSEGEGDLEIAPMPAGTHLALEPSRMRLPANSSGSPGLPSPSEHGGVNGEEASADENG